VAEKPAGTASDVKSPTFAAELRYAALAALTAHASLSGSTAAARATAGVVRAGFANDVAARAGDGARARAAAV